jgi:hypothetical protein
MKVESHLFMGNYGIRGACHQGQWDIVGFVGDFGDIGQFLRCFLFLSFGGMYYQN